MYYISVCVIIIIFFFIKKYTREYKIIFVSMISSLRYEILSYRS